MGGVTITLRITYYNIAGYRINAGPQAGMVTWTSRRCSELW